MRKIAILLSLILAAALSASAQEDLLFHSMDELDGLANNQVSCLEVDDFGYIWIGSPTSLTRYDGKEFKLYSSNHENKTNVVSGNAIAHIKKDLDGNLWFATEKGVSRYDIIKCQFTYIPLELPNDTLHQGFYQADRLYLSSTNQIYTFSQVNYLMKYNRDSQKMETSGWEYFNSHSAKYCDMDNSDCFWLFNEEENTITRLDTSGNVLLELRCDDYGMGNITKDHYGFLDYGNGEYWFGCNAGLIIWDNNAGKFRRLKAKNYDIFNDKEIKCIFRDSRGIIWIGTNAKETFTYNPQSQVFRHIACSKVHNPYKLNSPTVIDIKEDSRGLLWFGTWCGVSFTELSPSKQFHNVSNENRILSLRNYIRSFSSYGRIIAIGCDGGGTTFWEKGSAYPIIHLDPNDVPWSKAESGSTLAIAYDSAGYCYTGGFNRGITRVHPNLRDIDLYKVSPNEKGALQHNFTSDILCDSLDRIWILSNGGGLCVVTDKQKGTVEYHNTDRNGNPNSGLCGTALCEYDKHTLLVGSYIGFSVYDTYKDEFTNYGCITNDSTSLSHGWVYCFCVDKKKRIWVGTCSGLNKFDIKTGKFVRYGRERGLQDDGIMGILEDEKTGLLWISTAKGIAKFDPDKGVALRTYRTYDGLLSESFLKRSAHKSADGTMYFGHANGFTYFKPEEILDYERVPKPTITGMRINYERIKINDSLGPLFKAPEAISKIVLSSTQSSFLIEFISLNYVNERGNRYSYKMDGLAPDWTDLGQRHDVTFTNLDQGKHILQLRCTNSDGVVSGVRSLEIIISPPFYSTFEFFSIVVISVLLIIIFIFRLRGRQAMAMQVRLEALVQERTRNLQKANQDLEYSKEEMEKSLNSTLILNDLSRVITSTFEVPVITANTLRHIKMMTKIDLFALGSYIPSRNSLEFNHIIYGASEIEPVEISTSDSCAEAMCFISREDCYLAGEKCAQSKFLNIEGEPFGTVFILPILQASAINGVLTIACHSNDFYTQTERANLRMITSYLSIALEKAKDYHQLRIKNNAINGSLKYAKTIQEGILVHEDFINKYFEAMVIFKPKDIVSGDFYWFNTIGNPDKPDMLFAAVVDCTGHGVPGAFMSLISNILLNDIIIRNANHEPHLILSQLHKEIVQTLNQKQNLNDDGLDMAICRFDMSTQGQCVKVVYAGAKNSLYLLRASKQEIEVLPADRYSIGGFNNMSEKKFTKHEIEPAPGDIFYMTSDGIIDQNNKTRKRFGRQRLIKAIEQGKNLSMAEQKARLENTLNDFMKDEEQRDDITIMGIKL